MTGKKQRKFQAGNYIRRKHGFCQNYLSPNIGTNDFYYRRQLCTCFQHSRMSDSKIIFYLYLRIVTNKDRD